MMLIYLSFVGSRYLLETRQVAETSYLHYQLTDRLIHLEI